MQNQTCYEPNVLARGCYPGIQLVSVLVMTGNGGADGLSGHRAGRSPAAVGRTRLDPACPPPWLSWAASGLRAPTMARLFSWRSRCSARLRRQTQLCALGRRGHSHGLWRHTIFTQVPTQRQRLHGRAALRHPHFCLLQARFGSGPAGRTLTGSGPGRGK